MPSMNTTGRLSRYLAPLLLATLMLTAGSAQAVDVGRMWSQVVATSGSGNAVEETRKVGGYTSVRLETDARVEIRQGARLGVEVRADDNVMPLIRSYVDNGVLKIEDSRHFKSGIARVIITVDRLDSIDTHGSVSLTCDALALPRLAIDTHGSSALRFTALRVDQLDISMGGSSTIKLAGTVRGLNASLGGSSVLDGAALVAGAVSLSDGGSSHAIVGRSEALTLSLGGSASVGYYGEPTLSVASGGSATVRSLGKTPTM